MCSYYIDYKYYKTTSTVRILKLGDRTTEHSVRNSDAGLHIEGIVSVTRQISLKSEDVREIIWLNNIDLKG